MGKIFLQRIRLAVSLHVVADSLQTWKQRRLENNADQTWKQRRLRPHTMFLGCLYTTQTTHDPTRMKPAAGQKLEPMKFQQPDSGLLGATLLFFVSFFFFCFLSRTRGQQGTTSLDTINNNKHDDTKLKTNARHDAHNLENCGQQRKRQGTKGLDTIFLFDYFKIQTHWTMSQLKDKSRSNNTRK